MSLIYGFIDLKSHFNVSDILIKINKACLPLNYNDTNNFVTENVGLGNILRHNTPESLFEKMPLTNSGITITAFVRLDNRAHLYNLLNIEKNLQNEITDSALILKAYHKWKKDCVNYFEGDYVFAIWDNIKQELFISSDHYGNTGLYYYQSNDFFAFSSSLKGLLALNEIPKKLNEKFIVHTLNSSIPQNSETAYIHIKQLQAATTISIKQNQVTFNRYWFMENVKPLILKSVDDYIEGFLELYKNAVHARLRSIGKIGTTLSSGLDSSSVTALAALEFSKQQKRINAFTSVPLYDTSRFYQIGRTVADEAPFAKKTATYSGNIDLHFIKGESLSPIDGVIKNLEILSQPTHAAGNSFWIFELLKKAKQDGISTILTGQCGNSIVSWHGYPAPENILNILNNYRHDKIKLLTLIKKLSKFIIPDPFIRGIQNYNLKKSSINDLIGFSAINLEFANYMNENNIMDYNYIVPDFKSSPDPIKQRVAIADHIRNNTGIVWQEISYEYGLHIVDPTKDKALIEYCLSIPDKMHQSDDHNRYIIRKSMDDILPPEVQWSKKKGLQAADMHFRIKNTIPHISTILDEFDQSKYISHYLDVKRMKNVVEKVKANDNINTAASCKAILLRGINVGLFLQKNE